MNANKRSRTVVRTLYTPDALRKVEVFERANGTFGFEELHWSDQEYSWLLSPVQTNPVLDTADQAVKEAYGRISWLSEPG